MAKPDTSPLCRGPAWSVPGSLGQPTMFGYLTISRAYRQDAVPFA
jgi:hypothetical protein